MPLSFSFLHFRSSYHYSLRYFKHFYLRGQSKYLVTHPSQLFRQNLKFNFYSLSKIETYKRLVFSLLLVASGMRIFGCSNLALLQDHNRGLLGLDQAFTFDDHLFELAVDGSFLVLSTIHLIALDPIHFGREPI